MIAAGLFIILAVGACAIQYAFWSERANRLVVAMSADLAQTERAVTDWRDLYNETSEHLRLARVTVTELTEELAKAHRANILLRTAILDAERQVMEMAEVAS